MKSFSELLTEAALPKEEKAPKKEPTPTESAEGLSKKARNASLTADELVISVAYDEHHRAHLAAADAHHAAADAHVAAGQGDKHSDLHNMHAATHRSVARNHERSAATFAMGAASSKGKEGKKTVKEEMDEMHVGLAILEELSNPFLLTELDKSTLGSYVKKAAWSATSNAMRTKTAGTSEQKEKAANTALKRLKGIDQASSKLAEEAVDKLVEELLTELDKSTLGSYVKKASQDVKHQTEKSVRHSAASVTAHDKERSLQHTITAARAHSKANKRLRGIGTAASKLAEEETVTEAVVSAAHGASVGGSHKANGSADLYHAEKAKRAERHAATMKVVNAAIAKKEAEKASKSSEAKAAKEIAKADMREEVVSEDYAAHEWNSWKCPKGYENRGKDKECWDKTRCGCGAKRPESAKKSN